MVAVCPFDLANEGCQFGEGLAADLLLPEDACQCDGLQLAELHEGRRSLLLADAKPTGTNLPHQASKHLSCRKSQATAKSFHTRLGGNVWLPSIT